MTDISDGGDGGDAGQSGRTVGERKSARRLSQVWGGETGRETLDYGGQSRRGVTKWRACAGEPCPCCGSPLSGDTAAWQTARPGLRSGAWARAEARWRCLSRVGYKATQDCTPRWCQTARAAAICLLSADSATRRNLVHGCCRKQPWKGQLDGLQAELTRQGRLTGLLDMSTYIGGDLTI